jgi:hypothetical protein
MSKCTREDECDACYYGFGFQAHEFGIKCWMGPVARELREWAARGWQGRAAEGEARIVFCHASVSIGPAARWADFMSEAIEAAEALGL